MLANPTLTSKFPLTRTFDELGKVLGGVAAEEAAEKLLFMGLDMAVGVGTKNQQNVTWVPGNHMGSGQSGPYQQGIEVMVIGKMPGIDETQRGINLVGQNGQLLKKTLDDLNVDWRSNWYATNIVRFFQRIKGQLSAAFVKECRWFLAQEIGLLRPRFILLTGADAVRAIFKSAKLDDVRGCPYFMHGPDELGNVVTPLSDIPLDKLSLRLRYSGCIVFPTILPAQVLHDAALMEGFVRDLQIFKSLLESDYDDQTGKGDYVYIRNSKEMEALFGLLPGKGMLMALDCEWGYVGVSTTKRPVLRSIQISWAENQAACFVFHEAGGVPAQSGPEMTRMLDLLRKFIVEREIRLTGHNLRADALLLEEYSIPVMKHTVFDSMLADHMLNENAEHDLEYCTLRYTDMGRYDSALNRWRASNGLGLKEVKRVAYLGIPGEILYPYGAADADASLRIAKVLSQRVDRDPRLKDCYYNVVLPTSQAIYEIERNGIQVDQDRMIKLVGMYDEKKKELLQGIRDKLKISLFNPDSYKQMAELLFGSKASGGFGIRPVKTTGKPSRMWDDIPPDELDDYAPSTDQESLEYIAHENPVVSDLRDYKMIEQVQKSFLRLPSEVDGQSGEAVFGDGLLGSISPDGRIRTHLSQMSETGRHRSSNPNLQNLPAKQDKETSRIMGSLPAIRSCFTASPGHVLIEADYKSAEVFTLAYLSNCEKLIRDAKSDLHARGAVSRFGAPKWEGYDQYLPPPAEWLEEFKALRICSKTLTFGIPYQRGAAAIAREITKSTKGKVYCDKDTAQGHIDNFYRDYPEVENFVEMSKQSVIEPKYLFNPFGRHRRATPSSDTSFIAAQQREFVNFPIQSTVAECLNVALINFFHYRMQYPGRAEYRLLLAMHDAVLLECRPEYVSIVVEEVIPVCMTRACRVPSWCPTSNYKPTKTFTLDTDIDVSMRWKEKASADELRSVGLEEKLVEKFKKKEKKA